MQVSSAASAYVQQAASSIPSRTEDRVEGSRPDGDSDRDDASRVASTQQTTSATTATGSIGGNIDVTA